jgi:hypothetical protein
LPGRKPSNRYGHGEQGFPWRGGFGVPKPPKPYDTFEWAVISSFFVHAVNPGKSNVASWRGGRKTHMRALHGTAQMSHTIETLKELHEQRFAATDKAIVLAAEEVARRLEVLNHYHELTREKERTFVSREAFETFVQRVADDFALLRREIQNSATAATAARESARQAAADEAMEQNTENERRFGRIESVHAKIIGGLALGTFILPLITGLVIYVLTKSP